LDSKLHARDDHRLVIDLRIKLKESLDELASQQFQAVEAANELERCRTSRAELQLALEEEKQKIVRMRLANDEMIAELRQCRARAEKQADYIQKKVRRTFPTYAACCLTLRSGGYLAAPADKVC
jgi:chromosome segregation ATPase